MSIHRTSPAGAPAPAVPAPAARARAGHGLFGPRRGRHELPVEQLAALRLPVGDDGVVAGTDAQGQPAVLGMFRPAQLDVVVIGSVWTAQVLALRTAGTGARVAVETARPQAWTGLAQAAGGSQQCMTVHDVQQVGPQGASVTSPVLVVRDCGMRPPRSRLATGPWQSVLTLLPFLGPTAPKLVEHAGLVGIQRVSPEEAAVLGRILRLPRVNAEALSQLGDDMVLWCTPKHRKLVKMQPTDIEAGLLGGPRRLD
ncbi:hypothetical protein K388_04923 [Streptomyces sp. KhCrAH-43]|uniref:hypothetical protein n=1 Tax=Streptomyces TaxID=1883 RepID=UPI000364B689|nr:MULTISPECIES: hypothetical protein [unclassified Streptomyces]MYS36224.1 hypothetical protein [Streptomyces sp. SID4920]MYX70853.1 hypothetical protein [Streptomyces sp. SID8373]RAJ56003.1 hypothetical protein K388_04923 [Streptomyces sp. KhCrAH-43]